LPFPEVKNPTGPKSIATKRVNLEAKRGREKRLGIKKCSTKLGELKSLRYLRLGLKKNKPEGTVTGVPLAQSPPIEDPDIQKRGRSGKRQLRWRKSQQKEWQSRSSLLSGKNVMGGKGGRWKGTGVG